MLTKPRFWLGQLAIVLCVTGGMMVHHFPLNVLPLIAGGLLVDWLAGVHK
jgi:hypothetical protein